MNLPLLTSIHVQGILCIISAVWYVLSLRHETEIIKMTISHKITQP